MAKLPVSSFGPMVRAHVTAEAHDEGSCSPLGGRDQTERADVLLPFQGLPP